MESFHFIRPYWFLAVVPLILLLVRWRKNAVQQNQWREQVDEALLPHLLIGQSTPMGRLPVIMLSVLWLLALTALAGPSWEKQPAPVFRALQERVLIVDLSRSMDARDIKPSRLKRAVQKLQDILEQSADGQTALIVFSAVPYVVSPLTDDVETIRSMLPSLSTDIVPVQGSTTSLALRKGLELLEQSNSRGGSVWLLTDSNPDSEAVAVAREIAANGHQLHVIGVGTREGAPIPLAPAGFVKDDSENIVVARLEADRLRELAQAGGGEFSSARSDDLDIGRLFAADHSRVGNAAVNTERRTDIWLERGPYLVLILLPLVAMFFRRGVL